MLWSNAEQWCVPGREIKMIEDAIFLGHWNMQIGQFITWACVLTHPIPARSGKCEWDGKRKAVRKMKWLAKLIGLENKFSPFFGLPSLLFPRLHWRKCIKIGGDRNSISWQCFAVVYLIYLQIVPFLEFAKKINCYCLTFNPYHFDSRRKAKKVYSS